MIPLELTSELVSLRPIALLAKDGSVWITMVARWWDIASWLWWFTTPFDRRANIKLRMTDGKKFRVRAIQVARGHIHITGIEGLK